MRRTDVALGIFLVAFWAACGFVGYKLGMMPRAPLVIYIIQVRESQHD